MKKMYTVVAVFLLIGFGLLFVIKKNPNVSVSVSPINARLMLDNQPKPVKATGFYTTPGNHSLTASFVGFTTQTVKFTAKAKGKTTLTILLTPSSQTGIDYLSNHPTEANQRQTIGGKEFTNSTQQRIDTTPLIKDLPYVNNDYEVGYGPSVKNPNSSEVAIYITIYQANGKQEALDWINSEGFNPASLEIIYKDETSQNQQ